MSKHKVYSKSFYFKRTQAELTVLKEMQRFRKAICYIVNMINILLYYICSSYASSPLAILVAFMFIKPAVEYVINCIKGNTEGIKRYYSWLPFFGPRNRSPQDWASVCFDRLAATTLLLLIMYAVLPAYPLLASFSITMVVYFGFGPLIMSLFKDLFDLIILSQFNSEERIFESKGLLMRAAKSGPTFTVDVEIEPEFDKEYWMRAQAQKKLFTRLRIIAADHLIPKNVQDNIKTLIEAHIPDIPAPTTSAIERRSASPVSFHSGIAHEEGAQVQNAPAPSLL